MAEQFYWHRFFSHQPDLNFDNPAVMEAVLDVMHFWLDMGVDGLRLDAIPYLVERDGTNNENLPETHEVLKAIRRDLDEHYQGRMLLAEANQWPEDTRPYFGEGDECHMGFHFPLMPRMYMALAQEDRHPITDIIRQTPEIPEGCQWGIFLRNHDELTLEMVTDRERDYLWETYASDKRARINMGIRRRLAPLMQNDRRKIELLNSLLMSMPGTPILYYGDEIGMGDNYYLGDRDGVRTPMQWSPDRNAGFSTAVPQALYLPTIQDPTYGFQAVNVEEQQHDPSSLLNWMKRMIAVRGGHDVFGRGEMKLLYPSNRKVLAYVRETQEEAVLCVANLSRQAQAVELDLAPYAGRVPIEMTGRSPFPPVGALPYLVTLPAYGFFWFLLAGEGQSPDWHIPMAQPLPEFITLTTRDGRIDTAVSGREGRQLEADVLPQFLPRQRWFAAKDKAIRKVSLTPLGEMPGPHALAVLDVTLDDEVERYFLPLSAIWGDDAVALGAPMLAYTIAKLRRGPRVGALADGARDPALARGMLDALRADMRLPTRGGEVVFRGSEALRAIEEPEDVRAIPGEQSNASIVFGDAVVMKIYRRLREGVQPEIEVARFLTETGFEHTPALLGSVELAPSEGEPTSLASAFAFVRNQGDAWAYLTDALVRDLDEVALSGEEAEFAFGLDLGGLLGRRTAGLHRALATQTDDPAFAPEPMTEADVAALAQEVAGELDRMLADLERASSHLPPSASEAARAVLDRGGELSARIETLKGSAPSGMRTRIHGDYHLGQVLVVQNDVSIIDFEGEPRRSMEERRAKFPALRDVAGMLRSLDYAAHAALRDRAPAAVEDERVTARAEAWRRRARAQFLDGYREEIAGSPAHPEPAFAEALLDLFLIQKAAYEVGYEMAFRPEWVGIPLAGLLAILDGDAEPEPDGSEPQTEGGEA